MSYQSILWALDAQVPATQKLVLIGVASHVMADGVTASVTVARLAEIAGVCGRSVTRNVGLLVGAGLLERELNAGDSDSAFYRPNLYRLRMHAPAGGAL